MANLILDSFLKQWRDRRIAVLGLGVSNRPLVRMLLEGGCSVIGCDRTPREKLEDEVLELEKLGRILYRALLYLGWRAVDYVPSSVDGKTSDCGILKGGRRQYEKK